jgi:hypothetical protein
VSTADGKLATSRKLPTIGQDSVSPSTALRHKAIVFRLRTIVIKGLGSELPLPADTRVRQRDRAAFTCLAVDILRRASAEVRTRQTSAAVTACSEGTPEAISVATEVVAATLMVITTRSEERQLQLSITRILARRLTRPAILNFLWLPLCGIGRADILVQWRKDRCETLREVD